MGLIILREWKNVKVKARSQSDMKVTLGVS